MNEETKTEQVAMTAEERAAFEAFKRDQERKAAEAKRKQDREVYAQLVDNEVAHAVGICLSASEDLRGVKQTIYNNFRSVLELKQQLTGVKDKQGEQYSHTFTTSDGKFRITLGNYTVDGYRDTVDDGIAIVKEYIESLAKDENSKALVNAVLRLLSRDQAGNIKASRVLQLRKMAEETGNARFIEGVRIIEESYQPTVTKQFIRACYKNEAGAWIAIPLSITEANMEPTNQPTNQQ